MDEIQFTDPEDQDEIEDILDVVRICLGVTFE